jgi:N-acetyl-anhydromuramyl-L-alanine amidase AmpD
MRDVRAAPEAPYAAHTAGRNAWGIGIAICSMAGAVPSDFGATPLTEPQLAALCTVAARLAQAYGISNAAIRTHAEAALEDGYFGAGDEQRWDIARLAPAAAALVAEEARRTGAVLRARVAAA